eukprot:GSA25T00008752001.1
MATSLYLSVFSFDLAQLVHSQNEHKFRIDTVCSYYYPYFRRQRIRSRRDCERNGCRFEKGRCYHTEETKKAYLATLEN